MLDTLTITVLNRKGGVGKTHVCWLLASVALERRLRTLVIDLDPQANITASLLDSPVSSQSVACLFDPSSEPDLSDLIHSTRFQGIDVVPSSAQLEPFNVSDPGQWESSDLQLSLAEGLATMDEYDLILLDCPPSISLTSMAALCCSDHVIVPLEAAQWGALGTQHIVAAIEHVRAQHNSRLALLGYVVSRYKKTRSYQQTYLTELKRHFGSDVFETVIPDFAAFEKAVTDRVPITIHSPNSHACDIARRFFDEVRSRCEGVARGGQRISSRSLRQPTITSA